MTETIMENKELMFNIDEMTQAGLQFGCRTSRIHPKIKPYLSGSRNSIHIFDLEKTADKLKEALTFIRALKMENKVFLMVGTKVQFKDLIKETAKECGFPYITERWLGGTFTNFETVKKRIEHFKDIERRKEAGDLAKYTKKEQLEFDRELADLEKAFGGIKNLERMPDAIFVLDFKKDRLAVREAKEKGIKIVGIVNSNTDPNMVEYPIPANNNAISSVKYILEKIKEAVK